MWQLIVGALVAFALFIALFLLIRAFWLWYWHVDTVVALLESIRAELRAIHVQGRGQVPPPMPLAPRPVPAVYSAAPLRDTPAVAPSPQAVART